MSIDTLTQDSLSDILTAVLATGDKNWCALRQTCKTAFRAANLGGVAASQQAASLLCQECAEGTGEGRPIRRPANIPKPACFPSSFEMCKHKCDQCITLLKMSGEPITRGVLSALPGWHSASHELDNRCHQLERNLGAEPPDGGNPKKTSLPAKWTKLERMRVAQGDDVPMAKVLLAAVGDFCAKRGVGTGVRQVASRVEDAFGLLVAYAAMHPTANLKPAFELVERMLHEAARGGARWAWFTLEPPAAIQRPQLLLRIDKHCAVQPCFCGTDRHLDGENRVNDLPFDGYWLCCDGCKRDCHAECTGLVEPFETVDEATFKARASSKTYKCPACNGRGEGGRDEDSVLSRVEALRVAADKLAEERRSLARRATEKKLIMVAMNEDKVAYQETLKCRVHELCGAVFELVPSLKDLQQAGTFELTEELTALFFHHVVSGRAQRRRLPLPQMAYLVEGKAEIPEAALMSLITTKPRYTRLESHVKGWGNDLKIELDKAWEDVYLQNNFISSSSFVNFLLEWSLQTQPLLERQPLHASSERATSLASIAVKLMRPLIEAAVDAQQASEDAKQEAESAAAVARLQSQQQQAEEARRQVEHARQLQQEKRDEAERQSLKQQHAVDSEQGKRKRRKLLSNTFQAIDELY